jgi:hypothetical protein
MKLIKDKLTDEFGQAVAAAGLELVTASDRAIAGKAGVSRTWLVMDGLDTRLVIAATFGDTALSAELSGQAVSDRESGFFRDHSLFPKNMADSRAVELAAAYSDGRNLRRVFEVITGLLAPYARPAQDETGRDDRTEAVRAFLDAELGQDSMSLHEIAASVVELALGG